MPYPDSPFPTNFDLKVIGNLKDEHDKDMIQNEVEKSLRWLCTFPKITTFRINVLKTNKEDVLQNVVTHILRADTKNNLAEYSKIFPDVILLKHLDVDGKIFQKHEHEIIIDTECASAVLRGAHIYGPGVLGMLSGTMIEDVVSVYADVYKKCRKGFSKIFTGERFFIGNGIVKMSRHHLFKENVSTKGIAIEITETVSGCPPIGANFLPTGWALLQNLPSVACVHILDPKENETILDMCAAPGNKTTHIAALMKNKGTIIAIDKTPKKLEILTKTCIDFGANVKTFQADSRNILCTNLQEDCRRLTDGPPFRPESFDKVLLDAPCSVLGKRPQLANYTSGKVIQSYVPLQRKLFQSAVSLLKHGGTLVYSTCTITLAENEGIVAWALRSFESLELVQCKVNLGGPGWLGTTLTEEDIMKVQRFGPDQELDSVGFFIACFIKK